MQKIIKNVLDLLENKGFEAYVVGGYVRDQLLGISSFDIDICTNAKPKELIKIIPHSKITLGGISFKIKEYNFDITTYREELKYEKRKPISYNYINNLISDLKRRDFTINTICMNKKENIIDLLNGINDLNNLTIKMVGDPETKLIEDPLRIMRAIRFATILNFKIDNELFNYLIKHHQEILTLSNSRIKEELDKIFISPNVLYGLKLLDDIGINKLLGLSYTNIIPVQNILGIYAQINIKYNLPFTKLEKETIKTLKDILNTKEINNYTLYKYGLYNNVLVGNILGIKEKDIYLKYKKLVIHSKKDIAIKSQDIINIIGVNNQNKINNIYLELENLLLSGKIVNKKNILIKYINDYKARWIK